MLKGWLASYNNLIEGAVQYSRTLQKTTFSKIRDFYKKLVLPSKSLQMVICSLTANKFIEELLLRFPSYSYYNYLDKIRPGKPWLKGL